MKFLFKKNILKLISAALSTPLIVLPLTLTAINCFTGFLVFPSTSVRHSYNILMSFLLFHIKVGDVLNTTIYKQHGSACLGGITTGSTFHFSISQGNFHIVIQVPVFTPSVIFFSSAIGLIVAGANPNGLLPEGAAPIHLAAGLDSVPCDLVKILLRYGGEPNLQ